MALGLVSFPLGLKANGNTDRGSEKEWRRWALSEEAQLNQTRSTNPCNNHKVPSIYQALWKELGLTKVNKVPDIGELSV